MANVFSRLCGLHILAYSLVLIGAVNWGLVAIGWFFAINLNVVSLILGSWPIAEYGVYMIVGLSAIAMLFQGACDYCPEEIV